MVLFSRFALKFFYNSNFIIYTSIIKYNLKSTSFHLEGTRIPSFVGWIVIRNDGPQTMGNFIKLLLRFGKFSGVGIKTGIGMGALQLIDREEKSFDK